MKKFISILSATKYLLGIMFFSSVQKTQSYFQFESEQASSFNNDAKTWARMYGKGFSYPAGKLYPGGSYRGDKNLVWFACMNHGRAGR